MRRLVSVLSLLALVCCNSIALAQSNWAERLGFPAGRRVVILHANDMGIAYEFNRPTQKALKGGIVTSASVLAPGPWFAECSQWNKENPGHDIGVTLSFVSPSPALRWDPVSSQDSVPSLVTVDGHFSKSVLQFTLRADAKEVRREAERQINLARTTGLQPTHLHPHLGCMLTRIDLMKIYLDLAKKYWIPAVMVEMTPEVVGRFREEGFPLDEEMIAAVNAYPLPKVDDIKNIPSADTYDQMKENFFTLIRELKPGITQVFLAPADDTPGLRRMTDKWKHRVWEGRLLVDSDVQAFLEKEEVVYTNWREIMERFEAVGEPPRVNDR